MEVFDRSYVTVTVINPYPKIYHLLFSNKYKLAMHFLRYQEFYESRSQFKGKFFTIIEFMEWYTIIYSQKSVFTYPDDWSGYNVPGHILVQFLDRTKIPDINPYDHYMLDLIEFIKTVEDGDQFYLIGTFTNGKQKTYDHELAHAFFYLHLDYRRKVIERLDKLNPNTRLAFHDKLRELCYCDEVLDDEMNAYCINNAYDDILPNNFSDSLIELFDRQKMKIKIKMNALDEDENPGHSLITIGAHYGNIVQHRIGIRNVEKNHKILYNVSNLYDVRPSDYLQKLKETYVYKWIDRFPERNYRVIMLDATDLEWMKKAKTTSELRGTIPKIFQDEFVAICRKYDPKISEIKKELGFDYFFIRTDRVSLKDGKHGVGPYRDLHTIIESMITTPRGHAAFADEDESCTIYFLPWLELTNDKEFRCFVYNNKITAISQQHWYKVNHYIDGLSKDQIAELVNKIIQYFDCEVAKRMSYLSSYVMDLAILENSNGSPSKHYFIEPNPFGKEYSSGSALFHWELDNDILHNDRDNSVVFRWVH